MGFMSACRPRIHIFAGENVCIHTITPTQSGSADAFMQTENISSAFLTTGCHSTDTLVIAAESSAAISLP